MEIQKTKWSSRNKNVKSLSSKSSKTNHKEVLSQTKNPKDYQGRQVHKNEEHPIDFEIPDETFQPTMVEIKTNNDLSKKGEEKRKQPEILLSKNTIKMNKLKTQ